MAFKPTKAQEKAIKEKGNILVSAAAGSGKTAVLVERVISQLCDPVNPVRADELLIVTFTNAAAAEMRSRIENRLDEECRKNPQNTSLLLQKQLLFNAKICTIDSFCIDLVRENFEKLDISPDFKIGDENQLRLINENVLYSIINRYFEEGSSEFSELLDVVGAEFDERNFAELIFSVYNFTRQMPFPGKWFNSILEYYNQGVFSKENIWYKYAFERAVETVKSMQLLIENALSMIEYDEKTVKSYSPIFIDAKNQISLLCDAAHSNDWDEFYNALEGYSLLKIPSVKGYSEVSQIVAAKDIYKYLNGKAVEKLKSLFYANFEFINSQFEKLYPSLKLFTDILKEFEEKLFEAYKQENVFTFHNTEHLALQLLCREVDGQIVVNPDACELLDQFKEVLVDEYQDTNDLQNMLFYVLSNYEKKLFVVGDVKQSIYAFRGANPINFLTKKNSYTAIEEAKEDTPKKIILGNNFRSCSEVCDFVNFFFKLFMQKETGNIIYSEEEELIPAAVFPSTDKPAVRFDIVDCNSCEESTAVLEARNVARFIKETIEGPECIKSDDTTLRKATYGDFTILLRNFTNTSSKFINELKSQGIPINLSMGSFSESLEVSVFLSLLKVIDNPQNDIDLLTVLMSPIFGFTADDMAEIRGNKKDGNLYSSIIFAANSGNQLCKDFLNRLETFRMHSVTLPLPKLIMWLLTETEYINIVTTMSEGEKRRNNLLMLCDFAVSFISDKNGSIAAFADHISKLKTSSASLTSGDAVNIMTMHSSKGLQFPICILASTATRFFDSESREVAAYSTKFGFGIKYFDEDYHEKFTTISREVILDDSKSSSLEEELRLFYVGMTRAQDKLYFSASFSNFDNALEKYNNMLISSDGNIEKWLFSRTNSYTDWLILASLLHPCSKDNIGKGNNIIANETDSFIEINVVSGDSLLPQKVYLSDEVIESDEQFIQSVKQNFSYEYPYKALSEIRSKVSVSVLANKAESEKFAFTAKPSFMSQNGMSATGRGTAMHKVMQFFDFLNADNIDSEIERLYEWQFISESEKDSLNKEAINNFFESDIFKRIKRSERLEREMRFLTEIPAKSIDNTLPDNFDNEMIVVQGAVDICFIENGQLVILDFKTDRVDSIEELRNSYSEQLNVYAMACEKIFGIPVKEKIIYSFEKSDTISIK